MSLFLFIFPLTETLIHHIRPDPRIINFSHYLFTIFQNNCKKCKLMRFMNTAPWEFFKTIC